MRDCGEPGDREGARGPSRVGPHLEEGHGGAVADAEQEERDEDGDSRPEPVQLPVQVVRTALLLQQQICTGRGVSAVSAHGGLGGVIGASGQGSLCGRGGGRCDPPWAGQGSPEVSLWAPAPALQPWPLSGPGLWGPAPILSCALSWGPDPTSPQDRGSVPGLLCPGGQAWSREAQQSAHAWALSPGGRADSAGLCPCARGVRVPGRGSEGGSQPVREGRGCPRGGEEGCLTWSVWSVWERAAEQPKGAGGWGPAGVHREGSRDPALGLGPWGHPMGPRVRDLSVCRRVGE